MKRKIIAALLVLVLIAALCVPALAAVPTIRKAEYEGRGVVEVDFTARVQYRNVKVSVKDAAGKPLKAVVIDKDADDIDFKVTGLKEGAKYTFTISGVREGRSGSYGKVSGSFKVPKTPTAVAIRKVKYDARDKELDIEFNGRVQFKGAKVTVKDASGKTYSAKITDKGRDDMEVRIKGLKAGKKYTVTVSGVALVGGSYETVSKSFTA